MKTYNTRHAIGKQTIKGALEGSKQYKARCRETSNRCGQYTKASSKRRAIGKQFVGVGGV